MNSNLAALKRARTDDQKAARRRTILNAAEQHFADAGFEAFSMARVGRQAGVAKGTLYLYFQTREALLMALFLEKLADWRQRLVDASPPRADDAHFARAFYTTARQDDALLPLLSRLDSVIEHNLSIDVLIDAKRAMTAEIEALARELTGPLDLTVEQALDAVSALASLLLGAVQADFGPELDDRELPEDVRRLTAAFASEPLFTTNACRILRGIRAGH